MSMKNPLTPAGIEPTTFRFVAQHLNHCATAVPDANCTRGYNSHVETVKLLINKNYILITIIIIIIIIMNIVGLGLQILSCVLHSL